MTTNTMNKAAKATRRRALGRRLVQKASQISIDVESLRGTPDLQHLTKAERNRLDKLLGALDKVQGEFNKLGDKMEKSE